MGIALRFAVRMMMTANRPITIPNLFLMSTFVISFLVAKIFIHIFFPGTSLVCLIRSFFQAVRANMSSKFECVKETISYIRK